MKKTAKFALVIVAIPVILAVIMATYLPYLVFCWTEKLVVQLEKMLS